MRRDRRFDAIDALFSVMYDHGAPDALAQPLSLHWRCNGGEVPIAATVRKPLDDEECDDAAGLADLQQALTWVLKACSHPTPVAAIAEITLQPWIQMEPISLESRARDLLNGRQITVGGGRYYQLILGKRRFTNRSKLRPIDHFDEPEATLLQQHRFIQPVVPQSTADEPNTQLVAPMLELTEINCCALRV